MENLQNIVYALMESAPDVDGKVLTLNPHLFRDRPCIRRSDSDYHEKRNKPWSEQWHVLDSFLERNPNLTLQGSTLAYHGTRNVNRVSHIMFEGLEPSRKAATPDHAFFAVDSERCKRYGELILIFMPKSARGTIRGDEAFDAHSLDALTVAAYQTPHNYAFCDLLRDRLPRNERYG